MTATVHGDAILLRLRPLLQAHTHTVVIGVDVIVVAVVVVVYIVLRGLDVSLCHRYMVMRSCWEADPYRRPSFRKLVEKVELQLSDTTKHVSFSFMFEFCEVHHH